MSASRPWRRGAGYASPPPDQGLQSERTSLSWARTWALLALVMLLEIRLVGQASSLAAVALAVLLIVPGVGLMRVQLRHEQRVQRFRRADVQHQTQWLLNAVMVGVILVIVGAGIVFTLWLAQG